jgi:hypothetical protein
MINARPTFISNLVKLWEVTRPDSYVDTCDEIEDFWTNARVTGFEAAADPVFTPKITYTSMAVLSVPGGTAAGAAGQIENALTTLCVSSVFTVTPPSVATPPPAPIPGGPATPGLLTASLTSIFTLGAQGAIASPANSAANAIANFLSGWQIVVAVPPAAGSPVPII